MMLFVQTSAAASLHCVNATESCGHTRVAVLFSGGIDSLVLAALADRSGNLCDHLCTFTVL